MGMDSGSKEQSHKVHRSRQAGPKKQAKSDKKKKTDDNSTEEKKQNPKAFAFNSSVKAKRLQSRAVEKEQRRLHVPTIDRSYGEPAPYVVLVHGPPQVGKSLLIKSLVKHYTKHNLPEVRGPITIVSGKQRRVQFVECPNDINGMIDAAKFADLALLLIDGSYGFEMETFEFLNILQVHGFPKVMGVLTHLDKFKDVKKLRKTKQRLKHRFWTEIYDGAKLFYLSGLIHGKYPRREIHNLARFISVMKFHPLSWRTSHPYVLVDRFEDVTPPEQVHMNRKSDRNVTLYGYLRGCNLKKGTKVHIAGVGDYSLAGVTALADPCPLPSAAKKKGLRDKEKLFYAPMSGVGDLLYDKDAVYININDHFVQFSKVDDENGGTKQKGKEDVGEVLVKSLQNTKYSIDEKLENSFISLFSRNESSDQDEVAAKDAMENGEDGVSNKEHGDTSNHQANLKDHVKQQVEFHGGRFRRKATFGDDIDDKDLKVIIAVSSYDSDDGSEDDDDGNGDPGDLSYSDSDVPEEDGYNEDKDDDGLGNVSKWKESLAERTSLKRNINLMQLVYGTSASTAALNEKQDCTDDEESEDEEFFKPKGEGNKKLNEGLDGTNINTEDCSKFTNYTDLKNWKEEDIYESIRDRFVTGDWSKAAKRNQPSDANMEDDDDVYGDFEDLETGERYESCKKDESGNGALEKEDEPKFHRVQANESGYFEKLKEEIELQKQRNIAELNDLDEVTRLEIEGFQTGTYVRLEVHDVPFEMVEHFDPCHPILVGGIGFGEENVGYMQARLKRHRWHRKVLKTRDPIIVSIGWRRYQTTPVYAIEDCNGKASYA
ncbi:ribosome biogenesis protein bms1, putative [Ricinus communis]|uniref:Ribosome biogenesis protein bms1, putative n=1 Tax=Ricinus communis TaxID=3988 RepID=B9RU90_RICCO|nr:ribosome biogenesis protein bms1, putative [Ricinus communis]